MSAPTDPERLSDHSWYEELATFLGAGSFPATPDHLVASLIRRHAPSRLLWHLSVLPRTRRFDSLDELVDHLTQGSPPPPHGSPGDVF